MKFTISQRKNGIYYAEKMYKGKRYYFTSTRKEIVEKKLLEFETNKKRNLIIDNTPIIFKQWAFDWLVMYKKDVAKRTYDMYEDALNRYIIPNIGTRKLSDIKQSHIVNMLNDMGDLSRSKEQVLLTTKQIMNKAVENDLIIKNPCLGITLKKKPAKEKQPLDQRTISQIYALRKKYFIFLFMIYTGVRAEEVVAIKKNNVDIKNKIIHLDIAYDFKHKEFKELKNKETRNIPIFDIILPELSNLVLKSNKFIFENKKHDIIDYDALKRKLKSLQKEINKNDFTLHTFRHTYACLLYKAGIPPKQAQSWTGHKDIKVLLNIYTHLDAEDNLKAVESVNNYIQSANNQLAF